MTSKRAIHCCGCERTVQARLTDGREVYPHRSDLFALPFWKCDVCGNVVGCHHKTRDRTRPLGVIPTPEISRARKLIHSKLDPIWRDGRMSRARLYGEISKAIDQQFHASSIRSLEEAEMVLTAIEQIVERLDSSPSTD